MVSDYCTIEAGSVGSNEGTFTPRNFLNAASWAGKDTDGDDTKYTFYGYYPETGTTQSTYSAAEGGVLLAVSSAQTGEFGRYQICSSSAVQMSKSEVTKDKMVRFEFHPVTSLIRLRLTISSDSHESFTEAYVKQVLVEAKESTTNLAGKCFLTFKDGTLVQTSDAGTSKQINVTLPSPVKITRTQAENGYIDLALLATGADTGNIAIEVRMQDGSRFSFTVPAPAQGFAAGTRYYLDRLVTMELKPESDDATYIDGGNAWENNIDHDGFYTDAGEAW